MKVLIIGAGKMGSWFVESLCLEHEVAVYDKDPSKLKFFFRTLRFEKPEEIKDFAPHIVINAVSLQYTIQAFEEIIPFLKKDCILSDITSVKNGLQDFYLNSERRFVSTHPMFGPTFANIRDLSNENAIIISESDEMGKLFFKDFFSKVGLKIFEYSFRVHDQKIAYSLSIPFASSLVFASVMKKQEAPGTTFKKHMSIAKGLLGEDENLLAEILLNPYTHEQIEKIIEKMKSIIGLINTKDKEGIKAFVKELRLNLENE
jgi:prephenate dehydrogenase